MFTPYRSNTLRVIIHTQVLYICAFRHHNPCVGNYNSDRYLNAIVRQCLPNIYELISSASTSNIGLVKYLNTPSAIQTLRYCSKCTEVF